MCVRVCVCVRQLCQYEADIAGSAFTDLAAWWLRPQTFEPRVKGHTPLKGHSWPHCKGGLAGCVCRWVRGNAGEQSHHKRRNARECACVGGRIVARVEYILS